MSDESDEVADIYAALLDRRMVDLTTVRTKDGSAVAIGAVKFGSGEMFAAKVEGGNRTAALRALRRMIERGQLATEGSDRLQMLARQRPSFVPNSNHSRVNHRILCKMGTA